MGWLFFSVALAKIAIDSVDPESLCDRFLTPPDKATCIAKVHKLKPDSYLAAVCSEMDSDRAMYDCLGSTKIVDPKKLSACSGGDRTDEERLKCLKKNQASNKTPVFQDRAPSSR